MYEHEKLNRDDMSDKEVAPAADLDSPAPQQQAFAPDMPETGSRGMGGRLGDKIDAKDAGADQKKQDMAELERLKGLSPGHPDLESAKSPDATDAKVPEGPGLTDAAKTDAAMMSPEYDQQGEADVGDTPGAAPMTDPAGAGITIPQMDIPSTIQGEAQTGAASSIADQANSDYKAAQTANEEATKEPVTAPQGEVTPESPTEIAIDSPASAQVASAEALVPETAPTITPETAAPAPDMAVADAAPEAEVLADPVPEIIPEISGQQVAAETPQVESIAAPEVSAGDVESVANTAVEAAPDNTQAEAEVAPAEILVQAPAPAATTETAPTGELAAADVSVAPEAVADAQTESVAAPTDSDALAKPSGGGVPAAPSAGVESVGAGGSAGGGALGEQVAGGVSAGLDGGGGETVADVPEGILVQDKGEVPSAPAGAEAAGSAAGAPVPTVNDVQTMVQSDDGAGARAEKVVALAEQSVDSVDPGLGGEKANVLGGTDAANIQGLMADGATAIGADSRAQMAPGGQKSGDVAGVSELQANAKPELLNELGDGGAAAAFEDTKRAAAEVASSAQQIDALGNDLQTHVESFGKRAKDLDGFRANPGERTKELLGKGEEVEADLRNKAEASLGESLGSVKIHRGQGAREIAGAVDATAFTVDEDIVLGEADEFVAQRRENVILEELAHAAQMKKGGKGGRSGVSSVADKAEKAAKNAAQAIQDGAQTDGIAHDDERRAIYRNEASGEGASGAEFPKNVSVSLAGRTVTINMPSGPVERSKLVTLPSLDVPGLSLSANATLFFDTTTGDFERGATSGTIQVGEVLSSDSRDIQISKTGNMTANFPDANLRVGELIDATIDASIGAKGVSASGSIGVADLKGDKLQQWLTGGELAVNVDSTGAVSGSGNLNFEVSPFNAGKLAAHIENKQLAGTGTIKQTANIDLGPAAKLAAGTLDVLLTESRNLEVEGQLGLTVIPLPNGEGKANITWDSETQKIGGNASFKFSAENRLDPTVFTKATLSGSIAESQLTRLDGSGSAVYDSIFEGNWAGGGIELLERQADYTLQGHLKEPIDRSPVKVSAGALTIQVAANELTSTAGNVEFELADFMKGTAVLESGTTKDNINATATAKLVSPKLFDELKLSEGAAVVQVRGTEVKVIAGHVDMDFRNGVAVGKLDLAPTPQWDQLSGRGQANIREGEQWGGLTIQKGYVDIDVAQNRLKTAAGHAKFETKGQFGGNLSFNATDDFAVLNGTAQTWLTKDENLNFGVKLYADEFHQFTSKIENSELTQFKGPIGWTHPQFWGQVKVNEWTTQLNQVTGTGVADVKQNFRIGDMPGGQLFGTPGSKLTGHFDTGNFLGVSGTLSWQYHQWLKGTANITEPTQTIGADQMTGDLAAGVIAPHLLENGSHIRLLPSEIGSLHVKLQDGAPSHYRGNVNFSFRDFAKGTVNVQGDMLDFNQLEGKSTLAVTAEKALSGQAGMTLREGGALKVNVENSTIHGFTGGANIRYDDWMEGTVEAKEGSAFFDGITGKATGTLIGTPKEQAGKPVRMVKGGSSVVNLTAGNKPLGWETGSTLQWEYQDEKWLAGTMSVAQYMPFASVSGDSSARVVEEKLLPNSSPNLSLLPSEGLTVTFANNTINAFKGSAKARLEDWAEGTLTIEGTAGPNIFTGELVGELVGDKPVDGTKLTLIGGGVVTVDVNQNRGKAIRGKIPFKWGEGGWLGGLVHAQQSQQLRNITGPFTMGAVLVPEKAFGGGFALKEGGHIGGDMSNADIAKIGGKANFSYAEGGKAWVGGLLAIDGQMAPAGLSGSFAGGILDEKPIGATLKLLPSGGLTGKVANNAVTGIAGTVAFQYEDWLRGVLDIQNEVSPMQIAGDAVVEVIKSHHAQGNVYLEDFNNATFNARVENGTVNKIWGGVPWKVGDWIRGIANVTEATPSRVVGSGPGEIVSPKEFPAGTGVVTLHKSGLTHAEVDATGNATVKGPVLGEYGKPGDPNVIHVGKGGVADEVKESGYKGTIEGGLIDKLYVPVKLELRSGGSVELKLTGTGSPEFGGSFEFGWGGEGKDFLLGQVTADPVSDVSAFKGTITAATINKGQSEGDFKVLPGGNVHGQLVNPNDVKLEGGTFGYQYKDFLKGTITIDGSLNLGEGIKANGGATGTLTRDLEMGSGFKIREGSSGEFFFNNNELTKLSGAFGFNYDNEIEGQVMVEQGASNLSSIWGHAQAQTVKDMPVGAGSIVIDAGAQFELEIENSDYGEFQGSLSYRYEDEIAGSIQMQSGSSFFDMSGEASASLVQQHKVPGTQFNIEPGGSLTAVVQNNTFADVRGQANWSYGDLGWLKGTVDAQSGNLNSISGRVTGSIAIEKFLASAPVRLKQGGRFEADFDGANMTNFDGEIGIVYDGWIDGVAKISGGNLDAINGEVTASTKVRKELGDSAFIKPGATIIATFADSQLTGFAGSAAWQYENWLEGSLDIDGGSTLDSISGSGTATLRERKQVGEKLELERGGNFKAAFAGSSFKGIGGEVGWIYDTWLGGSIKVPAYSKLDSIDGEASVTVRHNKMVNNDLELQQGGSLKATVAAGNITQVQGGANWRYGTWIGGNVTLDPSPLNALRGDAEATILQHKPVGSGAFELHPGGAVFIEFDASKNIAGQTFTGDVMFGYDGWLEGRVTVGAGGTFDGIQGEATAILVQDKPLGGALLLKSGGNLTVGLASSAPTTFGGNVLWHYEDWLAGNLTVDQGSSFDSISGEASAHVRKQHPIGDGNFKLQSGGTANLGFKSNAPDTFSGHVNFQYKDFLEGGIQVNEGSTLKSVTGKGTAHLLADQDIGGRGLKIRAGSSAEVKIANNNFDGMSGSLLFGYKDFARGSIKVSGSKLDDISGEAKATIIKPQQLGGSKFKVLTGGNAQVKVESGDITQWGGSVRVQYDNWLEGALEIKSPGPLSAISGDVKGTLLVEKKVGDVTIEAGAYLEAKFNGAEVASFGGKGRFKYEDWLIGAVNIDPTSTASSISGDVRAMLATDHAPGGGDFILTQGGSLQARFKDSGFSDLSGRANWKYTRDQAKVSGSITLKPSTFKSISGDAKAHLTGDMDAGNDLKILRGGELALEVVDSKPGTFSGRVNWQYSDWLKGNVEVASGTGFEGPYSGQASARIVKAQTRDKVKFLRGGNLKMAFNSAQGIENTRFDGRVGVDYETWLRGYVELEQATLQNLTGKATMSLKAGKNVPGSEVKLLKGSTVNVHFANNTPTGFDGLVRYRYQDWLEGTVSVLEGSTFESVSGAATGNIRSPQTYGKMTINPGSGVKADMTNNDVGKFSGVVLYSYDNWLSGSLSLDERTTKDEFYGQSAASVDEEHAVGGGIKLQQGSSALVSIEKSKMTALSGTVMVKYDTWAAGSITLAGKQAPESISGVGQLVTTEPKTIKKATLEKGSGIRANIQNSDLDTFDGSVSISYDDIIKGTLSLDAGSNFKSISGEANVSLIDDISLIGDLKLMKGGNINGRFDDTGLTNVSGTVALEYDSWLRGTGRMAAGSSLDTFLGDATLQVVAPKEFAGGVRLEQDSYLQVSFDANGPTGYKGNIDITFDDWLKGTLNFEAQDLNSISGFGSMEALADQKLAGPLTLNKGSYLKVNVGNSELKDFEGLAKLTVDGWGYGQLRVDAGSTTDSITGSGEIGISEPKPVGSALTITSGNIGATVKNSELKGIYGEVQAEIAGMGKGWVRVYKTSTLTQFDGQAGLALTEPQQIGSFAELSGGEVLANFKQNELDSFGGWAAIKVHGWGSGKVMVDAGSTMDHIKGNAAISLEGPKSFAGGQITILYGEVNASVDGQQITEIGGKVGLEIAEVARGEVSGTLRLPEEKFTGMGKVTQIKEWGVGPAKIRDGQLQANVVDNELKSASGKASIDAGKFGQGSIEVNYIRSGGEDIIYGKAELQFQPHDRIKGILKAQLTEDKKFIGEGRVIVTISQEHGITGEAGVILQEDGHVVLQGKVTVPGPYSLFEPDPYKKDMTLIDKGFMVYTPPIVKVNVGAGIGIEAGIKPLEISNIILSGECDLMEPEFASMAVTAHMSSSAYVDLNAYVEGSVSVSAAVVAVEAGLRATLNLHLEAAINADPTITMNRNGLSFDMPVTAELSAALNLILSFFAKVRVGIDVGLFSIMKTVWRYSKSPDPLQLASMAIGARGNVHAGPDGFSATMEPEYEPPDLTIEGLKRSLGF